MLQFWIRCSCALALTTVVLLLTIGCGGGTNVPVSGKVTAGGKTLEQGAVVFHPDESKGNTAKLASPPVGEIDKSGTYTLNTAGKPGAPPGWYKVTVRATAPSDPKDPYSLPKLLTDPASGDVKTTKLGVEVKSGAPAGAYDLSLTK